MHTQEVMSRKMTKTYSELITFLTLSERFNYLRLQGSVGRETFGGHRYLNQKLYNSQEWRSFRARVIVRDMGCELGLDGFPISGPVYIHHLNPITIDDISSRSSSIFDLNNVICCSYNMHQAIHYGDEKIVKGYMLNERSKNDTCPWK